jgi:hypothetical protein
MNIVGLEREEEEKQCKKNEKQKTHHGSECQLNPPKTPTYRWLQEQTEGTNLSLCYRQKRQQTARYAPDTN